MEAHRFIKTSDFIQWVQNENKTTSAGQSQFVSENYFGSEERDLRCIYADFQTMVSSVATVKLTMT